MAPKKRRLSPSASSASSTPVPVSIPNPSALESSSLSALPNSLSVPEGSTGLAGPGPTTLEHQSKAQQEERREYARLGTMVQYSGDGVDFGEECFLWTDIPTAKNFRYAPCTLSPTPSPHPLVPFHRTVPYPAPIPRVHISWLDRSAFARVSPTALTITNDRGYRSARANVAVREGSWYFEVKIERGNGCQGGGKGHLAAGDVGNAHVRVGWGRREAQVDAPVGSDGYSYAIRDVGGEKVTLSRPKPYGREFKTGDVVGCLISLPPRAESSGNKIDDPAYVKRQRRHFKHKGQSYFESAEYMPSKEMDSLVDREGKLAAAAKASAAAAATATVPEAANGNGHTNGGQDGGDKVNGNGGGVKKGVTTKNTKKGKKDTPAAPAEPVARIPPKLAGSSIAFYLNGESLGEAFSDLYDFTPLPPLYLPLDKGKRHGTNEREDSVMHDDGTLGYYPMISCFGKGKARFNPGPEFSYPPSDLILTGPNDGPGSDDLVVKAERRDEGERQGKDENDMYASPGDHRLRVRPMCERWAEFRLEEQVYDERDEAEDTVKLLKILEEEEKQRKAYGDDGLGQRRKKGAARKRKVGAEVDARSARAGSATASVTMSRAGTMTPAPASEPGYDIAHGAEAGDRDEDKVKMEEHEAERTVEPSPAIPSRPSSPPAPAPHEHEDEHDPHRHAQDEQGQGAPSMDVDPPAVVDQGEARNGDSEDEEEGVRW